MRVQCFYMEADKTVNKDVEVRCVKQDDLFELYFNVVLFSVS